MKSSRPKKKLDKSKLLSPWKLTLATLAEFRDGWKRYTLIIAMIAVPSELINATGAAAPLTAMNILLTIAFVIMYVSLSWAIVQREQTGVIPRPATAYYDGSITIVRSIVIAFALILLFIPAAAAFTVFGVSQYVMVSDAGEQTLIGLGCLLIATPTIWWMTRFGLAITAAITSNLRPLVALKYSRRLSLGYFWRVLSHYVFLILVILVVNIPSVLVAILFFAVGWPQIAVILFSLTSFFVTLPLINIYLLRLYRELESKAAIKPSAKPTTPEAA